MKVDFLSEVTPRELITSVDQPPLPLVSSDYGQALVKTAQHAIGWLRSPHPVAATVLDRLSHLLPPSAVHIAAALITSESRGKPNVVNSEKAGNTASGLLQITGATASDALRNLSRIPSSVLPLSAGISSIRTLAEHYYGKPQTDRILAQFKQARKPDYQLWAQLIKDFPEAQVPVILSLVKGWWTVLGKSFAFRNGLWTALPPAKGSEADAWLTSHVAIARDHLAGLQALATLYWIGSSSYASNLSAPKRDAIRATIKSFEDAGRFTKDVGHALHISVTYPKMPSSWLDPGASKSLAGVLRSLITPHPDNGKLQSR